MSQIVMPQAGQSMEEGTIVRWHKAEGEAVAQGEILFEIETDKSVIEVEASEAGVLRQILVPAGKTVAVKTPVAVLDKPGEGKPDAEWGMRNAESAAPAAAAAAVKPAGEVKPVLMPKAGQSMEEGTLVKWRVKPGDMIKKGDVIFEVETDKSVVEVEATEEGRLARIVVSEGQVAPVLQPVAYIAESDADVEAYECGMRNAECGMTNEENPQSAIHNPQSNDVADEGVRAPSANGGRVKASPAARKAAKERGIDLAALGEGSGPGGRILSTDVAKAQPVAARSGAVTPADASAPVFYSRSAAAPPELKPFTPVLPSSSQPVRTRMTPMRKAIARNLLASKQNIPHWYIQRVIDADPMMNFYRVNKAQYPCSVNDVLVLAISRTIMEFPQFRSQVDGDDIVELPAVNIGIAVGLEGGLVVPVALGVERMNLEQLGAESKRLAEVARTTGKVENMGKGCFTISNLGMFGVDQFTAIINPPEAAILAVSAVREEVIVKDGLMRPGRTLSLTLSADHRLIDGVLAAKFMARLKEMLENSEIFLQ